MTQTKGLLNVKEVRICIYDSNEIRSEVKWFIEKLYKK